MMYETRGATRGTPQKPPDGAATPASAKKRKSAELRDTPDTKPSLNSDSKTQPPTSQTQRAKKRRRTTADHDDESTPFTIEVPARPPRAQDGDEAEDVFRARDGPLDTLQIDYAIRPGAKWKSLKQYNVVNFSETNFKRNQIIYVNRTPDLPPPPPEGAPDEEVLAYDKKNLWVGKIIQARAPNVEMAKEVFVLIFWLYWPEELPGGRQPYHGASELVMSNYPEIIDATSISRAADIVHWDEYDDENNGNDSDRFWRQTIDFSGDGGATKNTKTKRGGPVLSVLRKHCICQKEYNPDTTMYKCSHKDCETWNHEACLGADVLKRTWEASQKGTLDMMMEQKGIVHVDHTSLGGILSASVEAVKHQIGVAKSSILQGTEDVLEAGKEALGPPNPPKPKQLQTSNTYTGKGKPWSGKFQATISSADPDTASGAVIAVLTQLGPTSSSGKKKPNQKSQIENGHQSTTKTDDRRQWTIQLDCLKCGNPLE